MSSPRVAPPASRPISSGCCGEPYSSSTPWIASRGHVTCGSTGRSDQAAKPGLSQGSIHAASPHSALSPWQQRSRSTCSGSANSARSLDAAHRPRFDEMTTRAP